jgi:hypothetical protein
MSHTFFEIPLQKATGENPVYILSRARRSYIGYSFTNVDLRDKIKRPGRLLLWSDGSRPD